MYGVAERVSSSITTSLLLIAKQRQVQDHNKNSKDDNDHILTANDCLYTIRKDKVNEIYASMLHDYLSDRRIIPLIESTDKSTRFQLELNLEGNVIGDDINNVIEIARVAVKAYHSVIPKEHQIMADVTTCVISTTNPVVITRWKTCADGNHRKSMHIHAKLTFLIGHFRSEHRATMYTVVTTAIANEIKRPPGANPWFGTNGVFSHLPTVSSGQPCECTLHRLHQVALSNFVVCSKCNGTHVSETTMHPLTPSFYMHKSGKPRSILSGYGDVNWRVFRDASPLYDAHSCEIVPDLLDNDTLLQEKIPIKSSENLVRKRSRYVTSNGLRVDDPSEVFLADRFTMSQFTHKVYHDINATAIVNLLAHIQKFMFSEYAHTRFDCVFSPTKSTLICCTKGPGSNYCHRVKQIHSDNTIFFEVSIKLSNVVQRCCNQGCLEYKSPALHVDNIKSLSDIIQQRTLSSSS